MPMFVGQYYEDVLECQVMHILCDTHTVYMDGQSILLEWTLDEISF